MNQGFTLPELIIYMALSTFFVTTVFSFFFQILKVEEGIDDDIDIIYEHILQKSAE